MRRILLSIFLSIISLLAVFHYVQISGFELQRIYPQGISTYAAQPVLEFEIPIDSFVVETKTIKRDQTLSTILTSIGVSEEHIRQLPEKARNVFNIRSIKAGNKYKVFTTKDTTAKPEYLVYEHSPVDYVVFRFADSLYIKVGQREIVPVTRFSEAEISTSLWETMNSYNLNPVLALDLSEVFAWAVDFFGLYNGDKFKVIYDELYVDNNSVGIGTIHAAWFEHRGNSYYAYRFQQDSVWSYWDEQGNSLRKAFLKAPLRFSRISSRFSYNRKHPVLKIYRPHTGVDYAAPEGTPVMALGDGIVIEKGYDKAAGNFLKIKHNSVYTTGYNHFSSFGKGIAKGMKVSQGQVIGFVGKTGYATGPHLDLRFWKNGKTVDPLKIDAPSVEPIKVENREPFQMVVERYHAMLDSTSLRPVFPSHSAYSFHY